MHIWIVPSANETAHSALCLYLNVQKVPPAFSSPDDMPSTMDLPVLKDARIPTHVLALYTITQNGTGPPLVVPIDRELYAQGFRVDIIPPPAPGSARPVPYPTSQGLYVSLPAVNALTSVPHPRSFPLLLLFGLGLEPDANALAYQMLPVSVVDEFPNAAAMAQTMSRIPDDVFERHFRFNMGLWKNVLGLGVRDTRIVEMVRTAWNVTAEARRLRTRQS